MNHFNHFQHRKLAELHSSEQVGPCWVYVALIQHVVCGEKEAILSCKYLQMKVIRERSSRETACEVKPAFLLECLESIAVPAQHMSGAGPLVSSTSTAGKCLQPVFSLKPVSRKE